MEDMLLWVNRDELSHQGPDSPARFEAASSKPDRRQSHYRRLSLIRGPPSLVPTEGCTPRKDGGSVTDKPESIGQVPDNASVAVFEKRGITIRQSSRRPTDVLGLRAYCVEGKYRLRYFQQTCSQLLDIDTYLQGPAVFEFDTDRLLRGDETPFI
jgi:hypothetical protein